MGSLGPDRIKAYNDFNTRLDQANVVFTTIGCVMLAWGIFEMELGAYRPVARSSSFTGV